MRRRDTEGSNNEAWNRMEAGLNIVDMQGFLFGGEVEEIQNCVDTNNFTLELTCVEAIELDESEEFSTAFRDSFDLVQWDLKLKFSKQNNADLYLVVCQNEKFSLCLIDYDTNKIPNPSIIKVLSKIDFVNWWKSKKKTFQTKEMYEAKERQNETIFDYILESNGVKWGGNIDDILFDRNNNVSAIIENRRSWRTSVDKYDPSIYFFGTRYKKGDYMTWLPLVYVAKMLNVPLMLFTFSALNPSSFGVAVINSMGKDACLKYEGLPPNKNIFRDIDKFKEWLGNTMKIGV